MDASFDDQAVRRPGTPRGIGTGGQCCVARASEERSVSDAAHGGQTEAVSRPCGVRIKIRQVPLQFTVAATSGQLRLNSSQATWRLLVWIDSVNGKMYRTLTDHEAVLLGPQMGPPRWVANRGGKQRVL